MLPDADEVKLLQCLVYYAPLFENGCTTLNPRSQSDTGETGFVPKFPKSSLLVSLLRFQSTAANDLHIGRLVSKQQTPVVGVNQQDARGGEWNGGHVRVVFGHESVAKQYVEAILE